MDKTEIARGIQALKAHPWWTALGGLSFLGVLGVIDTIFGVFDLMQSLVAAPWFQGMLASPWFKIACLAALIVAIWRIGALTLRQERENVAARIAADDARSVSVEAERAQLIGELDRRTTDLINRAAEDIRAEVRGGAQLNALIAQALLLQEKLNGAHQPLQNARNAIREYVQYIGEIEAQPESEARYLKFTLDDRLGAVADCLREAHPVILGEAWNDNFADLPPPQINMVDDGESYQYFFKKDENGPFLLAHHQKRQQLSSVLTRYEGALSEAGRQLAERKAEIVQEAERLNG